MHKFSEILGNIRQQKYSPFDLQLLSWLICHERSCVQMCIGQNHLEGRTISIFFFFEQAVTCHDESTSAHMCPFPPTSVSFCFSFSFIFHLPALVLAVVVVDLHVHTKLSIRSLKALQLLAIPCPADQQLNFPHASPAVPNNWSAFV